MVDIRWCVERTAEWLSDPKATRQKFLDNAANPLQLLHMMAEATQDRASSMAFARGETIILWGPPIECQCCLDLMKKMMPQTNPSQILRETIWMGEDYGRWVCSVCETSYPDASTTPIFGPEHKEAVN